MAKETYETKDYVRAEVYNAIGRPQPLFQTHKAFANGGEVSILRGVHKKQADYGPILSIARQFAQEGQHSEILAKVHAKSKTYDEVYGALRGTKYDRKCPDLRIDGKFYEFESYVRPWNKNKIKRMLTNGLRQSDRIIIDNSGGANDRYVRKMVMARANLAGQKVREVWLYEKGKVRLFYKNNREE